MFHISVISLCHKTDNAPTANAVVIVVKQIVKANGPLVYFLKTL